MSSGFGQECGVPGDWLATKTGIFINRTGATLNAGDVVAVDLTGSSTEAVAYATWLADTTPTVGENPLANVVTPTATAGISPLTGIFVVANASIADDASGAFTIWGVVKCNTGISSAVTVGSLVRATSGSDRLANKTSAQASLAVGRALEAGATGTTESTTWVQFNGLGFAGR